LLAVSAHITSDPITGGMAINEMVRRLDHPDVG
jgi:hypothetical protein